MAGIERELCCIPPSCIPPSCLGFPSWSTHWRYRHGGRGKLHRGTLLPSRGVKCRQAEPEAQLSAPTVLLTAVWRAGRHEVPTRAHGRAQPCHPDTGICCWSRKTPPGCNGWANTPLPKTRWAARSHGTSKRAAQPLTRTAPSLLPCITNNTARGHPAQCGTERAHLNKNPHGEHRVCRGEHSV